MKAPHMYDTHATEAAIKAVLGGTDLLEAAARARISPGDLASALRRYQNAGRAALHREPGAWSEVRIHFPDWSAAESTARTRLAPWLGRAEVSSGLAMWWFVRKAPAWRLRLRPDRGWTGEGLPDGLMPLLESSTREGLITKFHTRLIYEPETLAFGGHEAMEYAHHLFHVDCRRILTAGAGAGEGAGSAVGRRETGVLLGTALLRGAGLDLFEQGDVWARVADQRPLELRPPASHLRAAVYRLISTDLAARGPLGSIAEGAPPFEYTGRKVADLAHTGILQRGLRAVLARHIVFAWNRLGLPYADQARLATLAREAAFADGSVATRPRA
jgi:thiopeptide-type bacteriocin biosynthesis protein